MEKEISIFGKKVKFDDIKNFIKLMAKIGLFVLITASIFILCHSVLPSPDDYNYSFVQGNPGNVKVNNLAAIKETAGFFYMNWTGRVLPHVLISIFRNMNPLVYEVANTIIFMIFITVVIRVLNKKTTYLSILGVFGYLTFSKMFGEKFAWLSGSFNYLWSCTFLAIFIKVFYNYFFGEDEEGKLNILQRVLLVLFAFVTGFMHENVAFVGGAFLIAVCLSNIKKYLRFDKHKKIAIALTVVMFGIGALLGIFAPGNFTRMGSSDRQLSTQFLNNFKVNKWPLIVAFSSVVLMYVTQNIDFMMNEKLGFFKLKNSKGHNNELLKCELLYFILPMIFALIPMIVIAYFPERAFLAYETIIMIIFAKNIQVVVEKINEYDKYGVVIAGISLVMTLFVFAKFSPSTLADVNYLIPYKDKVTAQYEAAVQNGERDAVVSKFDKEQWIHSDDYINIANFFPLLDWHWPTNQLICKYYGFDRVTAVGDNEYLIEIELDREGIHPYELIDVETGENVGHMEYDNQIRYCISRENLRKFKIDFRKDNLASKVKNIRIRYVGGELDKSEYTTDDIIMK